MTDTLPKHWGGAGSAAIPAQLEAKATSHAVLVSTLQQAGVLARLPASACRQAPRLQSSSGCDVHTGLSTLTCMLLWLDFAICKGSCNAAIFLRSCPCSHVVTWDAEGTDILPVICRWILACRAIFEAGEKLHAVAAVREAETRSAVAARASGSAASKLLDTVIQAAGLSSTSMARMLCLLCLNWLTCYDSFLPSTILVDFRISSLHRW